MWRKAVRIGLLVLLAVGLLFGNRIAWRLAPKRTLDVVVVDKTVPFPRYREHEALMWLLRAAKLARPDGAFLDPAVDFVGFDPKTKTGRALEEKDVAKADVLFLTDTYGVYRGDYEQEGEVAALERSPKIYGGLDLAEAAFVEKMEARGGLVVAEFNTFASPTEKPARERLERVFGVRWTEWVARFWPNLADENEVPRWLGRLHEKVVKAPLGGGSALVLVHGDDDIVVLRTGDELLPEIVTQERTPAGAAYDLPERGTFWFWMDVVEATDAEVLYEHTLHVTDSGRAHLEALVSARASRRSCGSGMPTTSPGTWSTSASISRARSASASSRGKAAPRGAEGAPWGPRATSGAGTRPS